MRPLQRLPNGNKYNKYKDYKSDLLKNYGPYCAYCGKKDHDLDVEHVEPKSKNPTKITDWDNLLLACPTCNRDFKRSFNDNRQGYVFPDVDETFCVFYYKEDGGIEASTPSAAATIKLCGLDRDAAYSNRLDQFYLACRMKKKVLDDGMEPLDAIDVAKNGNWSVWRTVFHDVPAVVALLDDPAHFPGVRPTFLVSPKLTSKTTQGAC